MLAHYLIFNFNMIGFSWKTLLVLIRYVSKYNHYVVLASFMIVLNIYRLDGERPIANSAESLAIRIQSETFTDCHSKTLHLS